MTIDAEHPTPRSAVVAWWRSMPNQDAGAIGRMTLDDYLSAGGPGVRTAGKDELLEGAGRFLVGVVIEDWSVTGLEVESAETSRSVAICGSERGPHQTKS